MLFLIKLFCLFFLFSSFLAEFFKSVMNNIQDLADNLQWCPKGVWKDVKYYEKSWFCNYTKEIHKTFKQFISCKHCNKIENMEGFSYWFDDKEVKSFDDFERKIKDKEVNIEVDKNKLIIYATTKL